MKLLITGGRDHNLQAVDYAFLDNLIHQYQIDELISGGARGADTEAEVWARHRNIPVRRFRPNWTEGSGAGFANNLRMAAAADALAAFPGGRGTKHMVKTCLSRGITILESLSRSAINSVPSVEPSSHVPEVFRLAI